MSYHYLLQLTDLHICKAATGVLNGINVRKSFTAVLRQALSESSPDYIMLTGDISDDGLREGYHWLCKTMDETGIKWSWLPGNHDNAAFMADRFVREVHLGHWRLLQLNSKCPGYAHGVLTEDELAFLQMQLQKDPVSPVLIMVHHPVCDIGSGLDKERIDSEALFRLISDYHCVKAVIHGHIHQVWESDYHSIRLLGTPSTCVQFLPGSATFCVDKKQGPGYRIFKLYDNSEFTTEVRRLQNHHFLPL